MSDASVSVIDGRAVVRVGGSELLSPITAGASKSATDAANSEGASAQSAAAAALAASGAIAAAGTLFPTTTAGLAATAANGFFTVVGDGTSTYAILYKKVGSAAVEQARYASKAAYEGPAGSSLIGFGAAGSGALTRPVRDKLRERVSVFDFGVVGDGVADDTTAIERAIAAVRPGGTLYFGDGFSFRISRTLIFTKPIRLFGSAKENTKLIFDPAGTYTDVGNGTLAGLWWLHSTTQVGAGGDARRSIMSGIDLVNNGRLPAALSGIVISVPVYFYEVDVFNFGRDGFAVWAAQAGDTDAQSGLPVGNANGSTFTNCTAISNGRDGFSFLGDNANRCGVLNCSAPNNFRNGFRDNSLLGNAFINCEGDNNAGASYWSSKTKPNAASFFCCYSETSPHFELGPLAQVWGAQGLFKPARSAGGVVQRGLPSGAAYISQPVRIAETDDMAEALGGQSAPGKAISVSENGLEWRVRPGEELLRWTGDYDTNYVTLAYNGSFCMRLPNGTKTGNIRAGRPWFEGGISIGGSGKSAIVGAGATTPNGGNHQPGAIWLNDAPMPGVPVGWVVTTAGEWRPFGLIQ